MGLSSELTSLFVKTTKDDKKTKTESTAYGTVIVDEGKNWVQLDGSDLLTPFTTTADVTHGERVLVTIKNHAATVTGNTTEPAGRHADVVDVGDKVDGIEVIMADSITTEQIDAINGYIDSLTANLADIGKLTAVEAEIEELKAKYANLEYVDANTIDAVNAYIENLSVKFGEFTDLSADDLTAINADIENLKSKNAEFTYVSADVLKSLKADIDDLNVKKLDAETADIKYLTADTAQITKGWFEEFYANSGIIKDLYISEGVSVKEFVGVTISGDWIRANTLQVDRLVVRGTDGNYYAINTDFSKLTGVEPVEADSIHGSTIVANSITAEKIQSNDLTAFGATIAGFHINRVTREDGTTLGMIYSKGKESVGTTERGLYMDDDGQFYFGNADNYIKFHKTFDSDGNPILDANGDPVYKLDISADSVLFGSDGHRTSEDLKNLIDRVKIEPFTDPVTGNSQPSIELSEQGNAFKQVITNTKTMFIDGQDIKTQIDADGVKTDNFTVDGEFRQGNFVWETTSDGGLGLIWRKE